MSGQGKKRKKKAEKKGKEKEREEKETKEINKKRRILAILFYLNIYRCSRISFYHLEVLMKVF